MSEKLSRKERKEAAVKKADELHALWTKLIGAKVVAGGSTYKKALWTLEQEVMADIKKCPQEKEWLQRVWNDFENKARSYSLFS